MARVQPRTTKKLTRSSKKSLKAPLIAGAIGLAAIGGAGGYVYRAATTPEIDDITTSRSTLPEPEYAITRYKLSTAKQKLASLDVRTKETQRPYNDNGFVPEDFADLDNDGCKTRYDILFGELAGMTNGEKACSIQTGSLFDYYTGKIIKYDSSVPGGGIDIDHIVAKKNAWESGGYSWDKEKWEEFVNDRNVLIAVSSSENRSKGDKDAADWLVPNNPDFQCKYVIYQIDIKKNYDLSVRQAEKDAMSEVLENKCQITRK